MNDSEKLDILYNNDGSMKHFYELSSERDIKETQIKSDENELEFKYKQGILTSEEYNNKKEDLEFKLSTQNEIYNDLIFLKIDMNDIDKIKEEIKEASLDKIELERLSTSLTSIIEKKLNDFKNNNSNFKDEELELWNFKYNRLANMYSKTRELESFIHSLCE